MFLTWIAFFNIFINIIHIIRVFNKSFRVFRILQVCTLALVNNCYFASDGPLAYKQNLSISCWQSNRLNNDFFFRSRASNYQYSVVMIGICGQFELWYFKFSFITSLKEVFLYCFIISLDLICIHLI